MVSLQQIKKDHREIYEKVAACKTVGDLQQLSKDLNTPIEMNDENINHYIEFGRLTSGMNPNYIRVEEYSSLNYIYFHYDISGVLHPSYFDVADKNSGKTLLRDVTLDTLDKMYQEINAPLNAEKWQCFTHKGFNFAIIETNGKTSVEIYPSEISLEDNDCPLIEVLTPTAFYQNVDFSKLTPFVKTYIDDNYDSLLVKTMDAIPDCRGVSPISAELIAALNARKSPDDLLSLSQSNNVEDRIMAAQDGRSGWDILNALAADADDRVKFAVIERNQDQSLCILAEDPNVDIRIAVAEKGVVDTRIAPDASGRIRYDDPDPKYRLFMAKTFPSVYYEDPSPEVRQVVAKLGSHLETLMYDKNPFVRETARSFIETNKETMLPSQYKDLTKSSYNCLKIAISGSFQERRELISNPKTRDDVLELLKDDPDEFIRSAIAARGYALEQYINDPCALVRSEVACCGYGLDVLANDPSSLVRDAVARQVEQSQHNSDHSVQETLHKSKSKKSLDMDRE